MTITALPLHSPLVSRVDRVSPPRLLPSAVSDAHESYHIRYHWAVTIHEREVSGLRLSRHTFFIFLFFVVVKCPCGSQVSSLAGFGVHSNVCRLALFRSLVCRHRRVLSVCCSSFVNWSLKIGDFCPPLLYTLLLSLALCHWLMVVCSRKKSLLNLLSGLYGNILYLFIIFPLIFRDFGTRYMWDKCVFSIIFY